jgi:hypothetical protein
MRDSGSSDTPILCSGCGVRQGETLFAHPLDMSMDGRDDLVRPLAVY